MSLPGGDVTLALVRSGLTRRGRNALEASSIRSTRRRRCAGRALCCPRRRAGLTFASKGQSRRNVSAHAGRQDALILIRTWRSGVKNIATTSIGRIAYGREARHGGRLAEALAKMGKTRAVCETAPLGSPVASPTSDGRAHVEASCGDRQNLQPIKGT